MDNWGKLTGCKRFEQKFSDSKSERLFFVDNFRAVYGQNFRKQTFQTKKNDFYFSGSNNKNIDYYFQRNVLVIINKDIRTLFSRLSTEWLHKPDTCTKRDHKFNKDKENQGFFSFVITRVIIIC